MTTKATVITPPPAKAAETLDRQFGTDHLMADLKRRFVRGGAVTLTAQGVKFVLQMASTMSLARLLTPADFGLIAMVTAVTGFVAMFKDAGLSMATVQRKHITHAQVSTLFWVNVALSLAVMAAVAALAPAIAWFYGEPRLIPITLALAATFIFGGLTVQHEALLRRQMRFTGLAAVEIGAMAIGIATAVAMAWYGFGYWALVGMTGASTAGNCAFVWTLSGWRPGRPRRGSGVRPMLKFGGFLTAASFLIYFRRNADHVLLGFFHGSAALGLYAKAYALLLLPVTQVNSPISAVVLPALCRLRADEGAYRRYYCRVFSSISIVTMSIVAISTVSAPSVIAVFLGSQWDAVVPVFLALAPAAYFGTLNTAAGWVFVSTGRTDRQFKGGVVLTILFLAAFAIGVPWGAVGMAVAFSTVYCISRIPYLAYAFHGSPLCLLDLSSALWKPTTASLLAAVAAFSLTSFYIELPASPLLDLLVRTVTYLFVFVLTYLILPGGASELTGMQNVLRSNLRRRSSTTESA